MNATRRARALKIDSLESLDRRITPSGGIPVPAADTISVPVYTPTGSELDKMGRTLNIVYQEFLNYQKLGGHGAFTSSQANQVLLGGPNGTSVGVTIRVGADFNAVVTELKGLGMQVGAVRPVGKIVTVTGFLPVSQLPNVVHDPHIIGLSPIPRPILLNSPGGNRLP